MTPTSQAHASTCDGLRSSDRAIALPVVGEVGPDGPRRIRPSRMGPWRAAVLIVIHLVFVAHICQWLISGLRDGRRETLSPLEPSESMQTLEQGLVNAGFVLFAAAIICTLILGRFFCGWGCHIVALQDLCGWMMKKCGIHPKPWRSRLLLWVPLGLALYMFVWPTFRREVLAPWLAEKSPGPQGVTIYTFPEHLAWLGDSYSMPKFEAHFVVEDFWATFPPWYIAVPFLLVCGFATVYFLGAKAFCTYGCPYGGFFAPADLFAPLRIRVNDNCNHCGHCTSVCTSNVRVSDEVRDFGAVVDPGCMKCLDCVSVCPNDALSLGFGAPALLTRPRSDQATLARAKALKQGRYDLTWKEEVVLLGLFLLYMRAYRGMYDSVPLLMAVGIASVGVFLTHKAWRVLRDANVRAPRWQLKKGGRATVGGRLFLLGTLLYIAVAAQGLAMWYARWQAELAYPAVARIDSARLFSPQWQPTDPQRTAAQRIIALERFAGPINDGGIGFLATAESDLRLWWCSAIVGDLAGSETYLRRVLGNFEPRDDLVFALAQLMSLRKAPVSEIEAMLNGFVEAWPEHDNLRMQVAVRYIRTGRRQDALDLYQRAVERNPTHVATVSSAAQLCFNLGMPERPIPWLQAALKVRTHAPNLWEDYGTALFLAGRPSEAVEPLRTAAMLDPTPARWMDLATVLDKIGKPEEAAKAREEARRIGGTPPTVPPAANPSHPPVPEGGSSPQSPPPG